MAEVEQNYSLERLVSDVFDELRNPQGGANKIGSVYQRLIGRIEHYSAFVQLFGGNWLLASTTLGLQPGKDEYEVQDGDFARPLRIETVIQQSASVRTQPAQIDIVPLEDLQRWGSEEVGAWSGGLSGLPNQTVPRCVAFWVEDGSPHLRFNTAPRAAVQLRIFYEPILAVNFNPTAKPNFLPNFFELLRVATADRCLPLFDFDDRTYTRLKDSLEKAIDRSEALLRHYVMVDHEEVPGPIRGWGEGRAQRNPFQLYG